MEYPLLLETGSKRKRRKRAMKSIGHPAHSGLGNRTNGPAAEMGLAVLSALSIAGIHSAINPSFFTLKAFAKKPIERANAIQGLWIGLWLGTLASVGLYFVFKRWLPALVSEVTALLLFGIGMAAVHSNGVDEPTMEKKS